MSKRNVFYLCLVIGLFFAVPFIPHTVNAQIACGVETVFTVADDVVCRTAGTCDGGESSGCEVGGVFDDIFDWCYQDFDDNQYHCFKSAGAGATKCGAPDTGGV